MIQLMKSMRSINTIATAGILAVAVIVLVLARPAVASAARECVFNENLYAASYTVPSGDFEVYARFGRAGQQGQSTVHLQLDGSDCTIVGSRVVRADTWQKIGDVHGTDASGSLYFESSALDSTPIANRPILLLVSKSNPVCTPSTECEVVVAGYKGYIRAAGTLLNEDTLHVVLAHSPANDTVQSVEYYVGNKLVYTRPTLEPFDMRYVPTGTQKLSRVISYTSRQRVVLPQQVEQSTVGGFYNYVFTLGSGYQIVFITLAVLSALLISSGLIIGIGRKIHQRHAWMAAHDAHYESWHSRHITPWLLSHNLVKPPVTGPRDIEDPGWYVLIQKLSRPLILLCIGFAILLLANSYAFRIFTVDGVSMQSTLHTGLKLYVNRIGRTWSRLNNKQYVPKRGEVIVFHQPQSFEFRSAEVTEAEKGYLVKRVLALPGERIVVRGGVVTIYSTQHPKGFNPDTDPRWAKAMHIGVDDNIDITLGAGEIFVSGDNRPHSVDSRYWGPVDVNDVVGSVPFVVWPLKSIKTL